MPHRHGNRGHKFQFMFDFRIDRLSSGSAAAVRFYGVNLPRNIKCAAELFIVFRFAEKADLIDSRVESCFRTVIGSHHFALFGPGRTHAPELDTLVHWDGSAK